MRAFPRGKKWEERGGTRTDEAVVSGHVGPALVGTAGLDSEGDVHGFVRLKLAGGCEGRQLDGTLCVGIVGILILAPLLLLQFSLLLVDKANLEGAFGTVGIIDLARALARGSHCVEVL